MTFPRPEGAGERGDGVRRRGAHWGLWTWAALRTLTPRREWQTREWCRRVLLALRELTAAGGPARRGAARRARAARVAHLAAHTQGWPSGWTLGTPEAVGRALRCVASEEAESPRADGTSRDDGAAGGLADAPAWRGVLLDWLAARDDARRRLEWAGLRAEALAGVPHGSAVAMAGERWLTEAEEEAWRAERASVPAPEGAARRRVWNGTAGASAVVRNWVAAAALATLRLRLAREAERNPAEGDAGARGWRRTDAATAAEAARVRRSEAWRALHVCRGAGMHEEVEAQAGGDEASGGPAGAPAGCAPIAQALAAPPPPVTGERIEVELSRPTKRRRRTEAAASADAQRARQRLFVRARRVAERTRARVLKRRRRQPETWAAVQRYGAAAKRRRDEIDAEAAAEERACKAPRRTVDAAEAAERARRLAEQVLLVGVRRAWALAGRAGRRGRVAALRARQESVHLRPAGAPFPRGRSSAVTGGARTSRTPGRSRGRSMLAAALA